MADEIAQRFADIIDNASESLFAALQCCYMIAHDDFYNVYVKDIFKVHLMDES